MTSEPSAIWGAVVVAAGESRRFGETDKLLADLNERPVIAWSLAAMLSDSRIARLALVTSIASHDAMQQMLERDFPGYPVSVCAGGATRSESVRAGLSALGEGLTFVAVHDGARPLASAGLVCKVLDMAQRTGAAAPAIPVASSVGVARDGGDALAETLDRTKLRELQTPQAARVSMLADALDRFRCETDETAALLRAGYDVALVEGERSNIKLTVPEDLKIARVLSCVHLMDEPCA